MENEKIKQIHYSKELEKVDSSTIMTEKQFDEYRQINKDFHYSDYNLYTRDAYAAIASFNMVVRVMNHVDLVSKEDYEKQKEEIKNRKGFIKFNEIKGE